MHGLFHANLQCLDYAKRALVAVESFRKYPLTLMFVGCIVSPLITENHEQKGETMNQTTDSKTGMRIGARKALRDSGFTLDECADGTCPACCSEGCIVEPDGHCEHGNPSVLLAMGLI